MKRSILFLLFATLPVGAVISADPAQALKEEAARLEQKADALLQLSPAEQKEEILKLSTAEAEALMNALSRRVVAKNADAAAVFYLYEHLASLDAMALAQKRLERLLAVFVITMLLFVGYLIFLNVQQNRIVKALQQRPIDRKETPDTVQVYRGE